MKQMSAADPTKKISFHDSSLAELSTQGDHIRLQVEDVWIDNDNCYDALIDLSGVRRIVRDGEVVNTVGMEAEDARVLALEWSDPSLRLVVTWISHSTHTDETRDYTFDYTALVLKVGKQESRPD